MRSQRAHHLFGGADVGKWFAHLELRRRPQSRAVRGTTVVDVRTGGDVRDAAVPREVAHRREHGPFTEVAAVAGIGSVVRVGVLVGTQHHQLRADLPGNPVRGGQLGTSQAGRVGDGGQHRAGPERPDRAGQHHCRVDPTREGHHQATQPAQPVEQSRGSRGGAEDIGPAGISAVHGAPSSHVRWRPASCVR